MIRKEVKCRDISLDQSPHPFGVAPRSPFQTLRALPPLQLNPHLHVTRRIGPRRTTHTPASAVYVQPLPNALRIGCASAVDPAPRMHRTRLLAAIAVAGVE